MNMYVHYSESKVNVTLLMVFNNTLTLFTPLCALIIHMQDINFL